MANIFAKNNNKVLLENLSIYYSVIILVFKENVSPTQKHFRSKYFEMINFILSVWSKTFLVNDRRFVAKTVNKLDGESFVIISL